MRAYEMRGAFVPPRFVCRWSLSSLFSSLFVFVSLYLSVLLVA
jgi:hypothetical protein